MQVQTAFNLKATHLYGTYSMHKVAKKESILLPTFEKNWL